MPGREIQETAVAGAVAATAVTLAVMLAGRREVGDAWAPVNAVAHVTHGEEAVTVEGFDPVLSLTGLALNAASVTLWSAVYRRTLGKAPFPRSLLTGTLAAAAIYCVDYHVLPARLAPGFEHRLGKGSIAVIYAVLGLALAIMGTRKS